MFFQNISSHRKTLLIGRIVEVVFRKNIGGYAELGKNNFKISLKTPGIKNYIVKIDKNFHFVKILNYANKHFYNLQQNNPARFNRVYAISLMIFS
ncbi:MAG: hypothetical protein COS71_02580 [Candidatus Moranbacteria bacterium CG06_land_8_20_14_3_00_40_12]|nr:MAG: hypothetical protein COX31_04115 [Candidatus Moranbacteria bacterium CG23_combo_of_CG06-09_8_20_14_all_40_16]PIU80584.1 MAG: hypothetical protein COS71_02580 [Candidatus Moranbacteria bacterium CG06_land_8_20_14_3_00_40_12]